jgi:hypothetical protein
MSSRACRPGQRRMLVERGLARNQIRAALRTAAETTPFADSEVVGVQV